MKLSVLGLCVGFWASAVERSDAAPAVAAGEGLFLSQARQLILEGRRSGEGYFSADGQSLVFQSEREPDNPFYQIYRLDFRSGDITRISPGHGKTTCAFIRPGTSEILYASTHLDAEALTKEKDEFDFRKAGKQRRYAWDYDAAMDLFVAQPDGSGARRLTDAPGYDAEGSYSPDGRQIVFCSLRDAFPLESLPAEDRRRWLNDPAYFGEIYRMNADGSDPIRLTRTPGYDGGPFFSPDGQRIVWRRFDPEGVQADIYSMRVDGSDVRRLTDFGAMSWAPFYHPSGDYIIFTSNKLGFSNFELFLVDALGEREPVRVTYTDGFDGLPVFSPDGAKLCWTSGRTADGKSQLFLAAWNDVAARKALAEAPRGRGARPVDGGGQALAVGGNSASASTLGLARSGPRDPAIALSELKQAVEYLAHPELQGRMTGSAGIQRAADYLARELAASGVTGGAGEAVDAFFQNFSFNAGTRVVPEKNEVSLQTHGAGAPTVLQIEKEFRPLAFTANATVTGEVVFVGYGLAVPGKAGEGYDSYAGVNLSNRIALILRYVPENVEPKRRQELNRYAGLRYKALLARERGAKAVMFVTGPNSPNAGELIPISSDGSMADSGIVAVSISGAAAESLLRSAGKDLKTLQAGLDTENPHAESGLILANTVVRLTAAVEHLRQSDRNVVAWLPSGRGAEPKEYIIVGAHYDHLGLGESGAMRRAGEEHAVHPGADDNASGTAAVLELAGALAAERAKRPDEFRRGVVFALWSGEEIGLIGSSHFAEQPPRPLSNAVAYINFDMVGRLRENKLNLQGMGSSGIWRKRVERRNVLAGFNLILQDDPYLPTDVTAFYPRGVPVLNFFTGGHEDYHRPTDRPETLNYEGLQRITEFAYNLVLDLVREPDRPDYAKVQRSDSGGSRDQLRVYLGTIPDYATDVAGVKIAGARAGSPAEKGGLKSGDVIVQFAQQKVANIYDYTFALDAAKIGQPVTVVVLRNGQRVTLTLTPEARK